MTQELFSVKDAMLCCRNSADFGNDVRGLHLSHAFTEQNKDQVYLAVNAWADLLVDLGAPTNVLYPFLDDIKYNGLPKVVTRCGDFAESLLGDLNSDEAIPSDYYARKHAHMEHVPFATILDAIRVRMESYWHFEGLIDDPEEERIDINAHIFGAWLQASLFLERFTFIDSPFAGVAINKFKVVDHNNWMLTTDNSRWPGYVLRALVHDELVEILGKPLLIRGKRNDGAFSPLEYLAIDPDERNFSSGSYAEIYTQHLGPEARTRAGKYRTIAQWYPNLYGPEYPLVGGKSGVWSWREPILAEVPKKMIQARVIAPESLRTNFEAHALLVYLRNQLERSGAARFINEHDQSVNRQAAQDASKSGDLATVDMSAASDSMCYALVRSCYPTWFRSVLDEYHSYFYAERNHISGQLRVHPYWGTFTSGHPLTWLNEAVWFLALARVASRLAGCKTDQVYAYGDDVILPSQAYETFVEISTAFGHTINTRKSYAVGPFRESCGGWYYQGYDITPVFWPRSEVSSDVSLISTAITLQHHFLERAYPQVYARVGLCTFSNCCHTLEEFVAERYPRVTYSPLYAECDDLWDPSLDEAFAYAGQHMHKHVKKRKLPYSLYGVASYVAYVEYLRWGPLYQSEEDEAWGISTSRLKTLLEDQEEVSYVLK